MKLYLILLLFVYFCFNSFIIGQYFEGIYCKKGVKDRFLILLILFLFGAFLEAFGFIVDIIDSIKSHNIYQVYFTNKWDNPTTEQINFIDSQISKIKLEDKKSFNSWLFLKLANKIKRNYNKLNICK